MPFTPAHTAAALPFAKLRGVSFTAVAVGSMVPDLALFLPFVPTYATLHSPLTGVPAGLPLGIACLLAFEWSKGSLAALLPEPLQARIGPRALPAFPRGVRGWAAALAGLAIGILTHVVWDAFTHRHAWGVGLVPLLDQPWLHIGALALPGYMVMQHASTAFGLAAIAARSWRWMQRLPPARSSGVAPISAPVRASAAACLFLVAPVVCLVQALDVAAHSRHFLVVCAYEFVTRAIAAGMLLVLLLAMAHRAWLRSRRAT